MTVTVKTLVESKFVENSTTTQYTATAVKTTIDKMTITNVSSSVNAIIVYVVPSGGSAGSSNQLIVSRSIQPGETYLCPEIVGHSLDPGDFLATLTAFSNALVLRVSGREIT